MIGFACKTTERRQRKESASHSPTRYEEEKNPNAGCETSKEVRKPKSQECILRRISTLDLDRDDTFWNPLMTEEHYPSDLQDQKMRDVKYSETPNDQKEHKKNNSYTSVLDMPIDYPSTPRQYEFSDVKARAEDAEFCSQKIEVGCEDVNNVSSFKPVSDAGKKTDRSVFPKMRPQTDNLTCHSDEVEVVYCEIKTPPSKQPASAEPLLEIPEISTKAKMDIAVEDTDGFLPLRSDPKAFQIFRHKPRPVRAVPSTTAGNSPSKKQPDFRTIKLAHPIFERSRSFLSSTSSAFGLQNASVASRHPSTPPTGTTAVRQNRHPNSRRGRGSRGGLTNKSVCLSLTSKKQPRPSSPNDNRGAWSGSQTNPTTPTITNVTSNVGGSTPVTFRNRILCSPPLLRRRSSSLSLSNNGLGDNSDLWFPELIDFFQCTSYEKD